MDSSKVKEVMNWPEPTTIKELQRFLGLENFYQWFIRSYSCIADPLTSLLRSKPRRLHWMEQARAAFTLLKRSFTMAPILRHLDPSLPFIIKADTSSCGIGAGKHWRSGDTGSREHKFLVLTDHHNLEYLCNAKRLNPSQAWRALFFTQFQFSVTYQNVTENSQANAVSCRHDPVSAPSVPEPILPSLIMLAPN